MGRIVVNKHFDVKSNITPESFAHKGEIIISNQVGFEGIFIKNNNGEIFYIAPTEGTGTDVPLEYKEYIESFINGRLEGYITQEEFDELIKNVQIDPSQVRVIANEEITSALTVYSTTEEMNAAISGAVSNIVIPSIDGLASEEFVMEKIAEAKLSGGTDGPDLSIYVTEEEAKEIALNEILKVVDSADTSYDTLKEIADWIKNDTTGAASMANDIANLKSVSADTRISDIEAISAGTRLNTLEAISADTRISDIEAISADTRISDIEAISADTRISAVETISADTRISAVEDKLTGLTSNDIYDSEQGKTQSEINQFLLQGNEESSKYFFMSTTQYADLVKNGSVIIDDKEYIYDENAYYALYEPDEE